MRWGSEEEEAVFHYWWRTLEESGEDNDYEGTDENKEECAVDCPPRRRGEGGEAGVRQCDGDTSQCDGGEEDYLAEACELDSVVY